MNINPVAPVIQSNDILIHAKHEKVWGVLTDIEKWGKWNDRIKNPVIKGKPDVGVSFTWTTNGSKIKSQIHTCLENKALGWTGRTFGATAIHNWHLTPTEEGTIVKVEESMEGWLIRLMKKRMNKILAEDMAYWLEQLKKECEME